MKLASRKYKVQSAVAYPHIGNFLAQYFNKNGINRNELARQLGVANSTTTRYMQQESLQFGILWKISVALKHNLIADLALLLPIAFKSPGEKELEIQLQAMQEDVNKLQQEVNELKIENKTYKSLIVNKSGGN